VRIVENEMNGKLASQEACVGVRVNPLLGSGAIETLSVSNARSKFGMPLPDVETRERLVGYFVKYSWLRGLHVHVGSQGCGMVMLAAGATYVVDLADEIDDRCGAKRISTIDIGGGLPSNYGSESMGGFSFSDYVAALRKGCPRLFDTKRRVVTEFGRAIQSKIGWVAAEIEYVKNVPNVANKADFPQKTLVTHAGADLFMRTCYSPESFPVRIEAFRCDRGSSPCVFAAKDEAVLKYDIAGPLCFGGDKIGLGIELSQHLKEGDFVVVLDSGANCLSLWSHHCSRVPPPVFAYSRTKDNAIEIQLVKETSSSLRHTLDFWK